MTLPNALLFGTVKSGSSSLYYYLRQHPEIYTSPTKEPNFFAFLEQKPEFAGPDDEIINERSVTDWAGYEALFNGVMKEKIVCEASVMYIYNSSAALHIKQYLPNVKLFALLRNPADRAFSSYLHTRRDGREPADSFVEALNIEPQRIAENWGHLFHYRQMGFYYEQLKGYYKLFPAEQIAIFKYEDFARQPLPVIKQIFRFLQVDHTFQPDTTRRYNVSGTPKSKLLQRWLTRPNSLKNLLKPVIPDRIRNDLIMNNLKQFNMNVEKPALDPAIREKLLNGYRDDILKLQDLVQIDFSTWLS